MLQTFSHTITMAAYDHEVAKAFLHDEAVEEALALDPAHGRPRSFVTERDILEAPQTAIGFQKAYKQGDRVHSEAARLRKLAIDAANALSVRDNMEHKLEETSYVETLTENMA